MNLKLVLWLLSPSYCVDFRFFACRAACCATISDRDSMLDHPSDVCIDSIKGRRTPRSWHNNFNGIYCWNDLQYNLLPLQDAGRYTFCVRYFWEYRALSSSLFSLFSLLLSCWFVTLLSVDLVSLFWRLEGAWLWHVLYSLHWVFMVYVVAAISLRLNGNTRSHSGSFPNGDVLSESQDGGELNRRKWSANLSIPIGIVLRHRDSSDLNGRPLEYTAHLFCALWTNEEAVHNPGPNPKVM